MDFYGLHVLCDLPTSESVRHMITAPKINTALLLNLKASTLVLINELDGYEYPVSGDALTLLTGPVAAQDTMWEWLMGK